MFLHETTIHKMPVADWKTVKIFGNLGTFCAATSPPMYLVFFSDFQNVWICYWKRKKYYHFRTQKVSYKHNARTTILRSRSISAQSWVMLWTPNFFVRFFVVVLGGVVFRFPNNLEKNRSKSFGKSHFLTFWWSVHWCFIMEQEVYWF